MDYSEYTTSNRSAIKRFSHARRFETAASLMQPGCSDSVLDFGTGDGFMLSLLERHAPGRIVGYEPLDSQYVQLERKFSGAADSGIEITRTTERLESGSFDKISCLEVLEHLTDQAQQRAITEIKRLLSARGIAVISVPIETGLPGLVKNLLRVALRQTHPGTSIPNIIRSALSIPVDRGPGPFIISHLGFRYLDAKDNIERAGLSIEKICFSPFPRLGRHLNSQIFFVARQGRAMT